MQIVRRLWTDTDEQTECQRYFFSALVFFAQTLKRREEFNSAELRNSPPKNICSHIISKRWSTWLPRTSKPQATENFFAFRARLTRGWVGFVHAAAWTWDNFHTQRSLLIRWLSCINFFQRLRFFLALMLVACMLQCVHWTCFYNSKLFHVTKEQATTATTHKQPSHVLVIGPLCDDNMLPVQNLVTSRCSR